MHPFLTDQVANARLAEIHAAAKRRRAIQDLDPGRRWRFWRRPRPGPPPRLVFERPPRAIEPVAAADRTLRPVA
jgi:hypothetical protein